MDPTEDPVTGCVPEGAVIADDAWESLLDHIRNGLVVPVVGSQLLNDASGTGGPVARVAARLLELHHLTINASSLTPGRELDEAIGLLLRDGKLRQLELYESVHRAIGHVTKDDASIPLPIRQLATIADFRLIVTVTPDDMLARCLRRRCSVNEIIHSPNRPGSLHDLPEDWQSRSAAEVHLLYLFGKSQLGPVFAIHEEDVLEYAHNVIARGSNVPNAFLGELREKDLLFIGCKFPDWLSRFFLRATNKERLSRERRKREWMIERLRPEESLTLFLHSYSKDTEILSHMEPAAFVDELHRRWMQQHGANAPAPPEPDPWGSLRGAMFFISYSRISDQGRAEAVVQALLDLGVSAQEVWIDRSAIAPGSDYERRILAGIRGCQFFVPLLSEAASERGEAFVFSEWREANKRLKIMGREFVVPLIVDAIYQPERFTSRQVPDWPVGQWSAIDFGHAPEGIPDARTLSHLRALVRQVRGAGGTT